jgi:hypothetical protein
MDPVVERMLQPEIVWVFIPLLAILLAGLTKMVKVVKGGSVNAEAFDQMKAEVEQLRVEVNELRRYQQHMPTIAEGRNL